MYIYLNEGSVKDYLKKKNIVKKIGTRKTPQGTISHYDILDVDQLRHRTAMFSVNEHEDGWFIVNASVPEQLKRQGIATNFYIWMNKESLKKTGNKLRSSPPKLLNGEIVHELLPDGEALWDSLVKRGYAKQIGYKQYIFK